MARQKDIAQRQRNEELPLETRMARALNHPVRVHLLILLNQRPMAAVEMAPIVGRELSNASYHARVLWKYGLIDEVKTEMNRGGLKTTYRACARMMLDDAAFNRLEPDAMKSVSAISVNQLLDRIKEAFDADTFDIRRDSHMSTTTTLVDEKGWGDIRDVLAEAVARIVEVQGESANRAAGDRDDRFLATFGILSFESPPRKQPS